MHGFVVIHKRSHTHTQTILKLQWVAVVLGTSLMFFHLAVRVSLRDPLPTPHLQLIQR